MRTVTVDSDRRITVAAELVRDAPWLAVTEEIQLWMLVVAPGRYRLVFPKDAERSQMVRVLLERMRAITGPDLNIDPADAEPAEFAALGARLVGVMASPKDPSGWRFTVPKRLPPVWMIAASDLVHLLISQGYLEVWTGETLAGALSVPLGRLIPD